MPEILKAVALGTPGGKGQNGIEAIESLNGALFIHAEHGGVGRRLQIEADNVGSLGLEARVVASHVMTPPGRLQTGLGPDASNPHVTDAQSGGELARTPMRGTVRGLVMQAPINDPGFQPFGARSHRLAQMASPETRDAFLQKRSRQSLTVLTLQDWLRLTAAKVCPPARPRMIRTRRTSSARRLWLRLMRFNSRRSGGLNLKGAGMKKTIHLYRQMSLLQCTSYYRSGRSSLESRRIRKEVLELSGKHPRYGYRRITALMRREGFEVNAKRVARIRREEGIKVSKKQRRMRQLGISTAERQRAESPGQVWSWDFVTDQTENGSCFRILTLLDEYTRQCLAIHPASSIRAVDVITVVEAAIARYGAPEHLRSDNEPEFIATCIQDWLKAQEIKTLYIRPGSPSRTDTLRAFMTSCAMNASTASSSAICAKCALSWRASVSNTMNVVRTARLATGPRTSMPGPK